MRYHPVVPTGGLRDTPPEGMTIGGTFIPGNTTIVAPRYILFRCKFVDSIYLLSLCLSLTEFSTSGIML